MTTTEFPILFTDLADNDFDATLFINVTDEGIIADVIVDGEVVATWSAMAQDIADDFCH